MHFSDRLKTSLLVSVLGISLGTISTGCSTVKKILGTEKESYVAKPISNPFGDFHPDVKEAQKGIVVRTRSGNRQVEVELPGGNKENNTDLVIPYQGGIAGNGGNSGGLDRKYVDRKPTATDREITRGFKSTLSPEDQAKRGLIEKNLGLMPSDNPEDDVSYLGAIDYVRQLYRTERYEVALLEVDKLIRQYPTDPRLYEMRGTLLDRLGHADLAMKNWRQALKLDPTRESLRKFIENRERIRAKTGGYKPR